MLSKNAKKVLKLLKKSDNQKISYYELNTALGWNTDKVQSACNQLIEERLATEKNITFPPNKAQGAWGIVLTERGRYYRKYIMEDIAKFILKSILVPIIVSLLTTLITLLLTGIFTN